MSVGQICQRDVDIVGTQECWRNEYALWNHEFNLWQDELRLIRDNLCDVPTPIETYAKQLTKHSASLALYGQEALEREHATAESERYGSDGRLAMRACAHQAEVEHRAHLRDVHEQLKRLHHAIIARCSLLNAIPANGCRSKQACQARRIQG